MTDKKISELTSITGGSVSDANDVLVIVDTSAGTTKKITRQELFKAVSAIDVTGDITVGGTVDGRDLATDGAKLDGIDQGLSTTDSPTFGTLYIEDGSAASPSLANTGDTNTGVFFPAADAVAVTAGGAEKLRADALGVGIGSSPVSGYALTVSNSAGSKLLLSSSAGGTELYFDNSGANLQWIKSDRTAGDIRFGVFNTEALRIEGVGNTRPGSDNAYDIGTASYRWDDVYATNGTIQTSDRKEKCDIGPVPDVAKRVAKRIKDECWVQYRWIESVNEKGDDARYHYGVIAQDVEAICIEEGFGTDRASFFIRAPKFKTVEKTRVVQRQKTEAVKEERETIEVIDGVPTVVNGVVEIQKPVVEMKPLMKDGAEVKRAVEIGRDEDNVPIFESRSVLYPVPVMEDFEETYFEEEPDGERLGIRYTELHNFMIAAGVLG